MAPFDWWRGPPMSCCGPRLPEVPPASTQPIAAYCTNLPASGVPHPASADDTACAVRLADAEQKLAELSRSNAIKLRVGFGTFFAEAADVASLWTIGILVLILAVLAGAIVRLLMRLTAHLNRTLTSITEMLSAMVNGLHTLSADGVAALRGVAKSFSGVAASILALTLVLLLVVAVQFFGDSGARHAWPNSPPIGTVAGPAGTAAADRALLSTAIDALARAAAAERASPVAGQQLVPGLAGAGVGLVIGVLAALLFTATRATPRPAPLSIASDGMVPPSAATDSPPRPYAAPLADELLRKFIALWVQQLDTRLAALKSALAGGLPAAAVPSAPASDAPSPEWARQFHEAASDLRRDVDEMLRLTAASADPASKG